MPAPQLNDPAIDPQLASYYANLDELTGRALSGEIDEDEFRDELKRLAAAALLLAFLLAGGDDENAEAQAQLIEAATMTAESAEALAGDLFDGRYSQSDTQTADEGRGKLRTHLELWVFAMAGMFTEGQVYSRPVNGREKTFRWDLGFTFRHCRDCAGLAGTILTASEWQQAGIAPQHHDLECGGWRCDCRLTETDEASIGFENVTI